jgi:iron complex outermembrane receptor protein
MRLILLIVLLLIKFNLSSQTNGVIEGTIESDKNKVFLAVVKILELNKSIFSDKNGYFKFEEVPFGVYTLIIEEPDYETVTKTIRIKFQSYYSIKTNY